MSLNRFGLLFGSWAQLPKTVALRTLSTTVPRPLKEIHVEKQNDTLVINSEYVDSARKPYLMREVATASEKRFCPKCTLGLDIKHTDVLILSQYLRSDGCMLPRRITGLCNVQQKRIGKLVTMAQKAGLMPNLAPANSKRDPTKRFEWKKYNKYFDESTIKLHSRRIE